MANEGTAQLFKKLFEQSFIVICLAIASYFLVVEYKSIFTKLLDKNDRDEEILLRRVQELNEENKELYERLIKCEK